MQLMSVEHFQLNGTAGCALKDAALAYYGELPGFATLNARSPSIGIGPAPLSSYVFLEPIRIFWADEIASYALESGGQIERFASPWQALESAIQALENTSVPRAPLMAGFLSYELLHQIETVPDPLRITVPTPLYYFCLYRTVLEVPSQSEAAPVLHVANFGALNLPFWTADINLLTAAKEHSNFSGALGDSAPSFKAEHPFLEAHSNFSRRDYVRIVEEIKDQIRQGDVYQVNLSQQFTLPFAESSTKLFYELAKHEQADHSAFIQCAVPSAPALSIVSSSPELFVRSSGNSLLCSPIKGTRPRGESALEDRALAAALLASPKDRAELAMIVDLIRNDLGKVATIGTVRVENYPHLSSHRHVHHLVADITCDLKSESSTIEILRALFPSGSVTGAPKIAAMQIIAKREGCNRGVYTGAIGILRSARDFEFSVAIRSAHIINSKMIFNSGGGIVIDSNGEDEYVETMNKARGLYTAWKAVTGLQRPNSLSA